MRNWGEDREGREGVEFEVFEGGGYSYLFV
jgi:hypothetical protein